MSFILFEEGLICPDVAGSQTKLGGTREFGYIHDLDDPLKLEVFIGLNHDNFLRLQFIQLLAQQSWQVVQIYLETGLDKLRLFWLILMKMLSV